MELHGALVLVDLVCRWEVLLHEAFCCIGIGRGEVDLLQAWKKRERIRTSDFLEKDGSSSGWQIVTYQTEQIANGILQLLRCANAFHCPLERKSYLMPFTMITLSPYTSTRRHVDTHSASVHITSIYLRHDSDPCRKNLRFSHTGCTTLVTLLLIHSSSFVYVIFRVFILLICFLLAYLWVVRMKALPGRTCSRIFHN